MACSQLVVSHCRPVGVGKSRKSRRIRRKWTTLDPTFPVPHQILAELYMGQNKWDEALLQLARAIDLDPQNLAQNRTYRQNRADVLFRLGRDDEARAELEEVADLLTQMIKEDPTRATLWSDRADVREGYRDWQGAIKDRQQRILLEPNDAFALNSLATLLAECPDVTHRDTAKAVRLAEKAVELAGDSAAVLTGS